VWIPPFVTGCAVWLPIVWLLYGALGVTSLAGGAVAFGMVLAMLAPAWGPLREAWPLLLGSLLAWAAGLALAIVSPRFTEDHPRKLNVEYQLVVPDGAPPVARWTAVGLPRELPEGMGASARFGQVPEQPYPWPTWNKGFVAEAPPLSLQPPSFTIRSSSVVEGRLVLQGTLASPRGALEAGLALPTARLKRVRVNGKTPPEQESKNLVPRLLAGDGWVNVMTCTTGTEGVTYELELDGTDPVEGYAWDATSGVPEEGKSLLASRPANAVPFQSGDRTVVIRPLRLQP
jgi:hypothetical protein